MPIPLATHRISVLEKTELYNDPGTAESWRTVATGIRAVLGTTGGIGSRTRGAGARAVAQGGEQLTTTLSIQCDSAPITRLSKIRDEGSGLEYLVDWIEPLPIFNAMTGAISRTEGYI